MPLKLISATPSAYARMNRIALIEKKVPFELQNEIPWHSDTKTPLYNPLEKLPILILEDGSAVYDSAHIQEYIVQKFADREPKLMPEGIDAGLKARQIQVLAEGHMDALSLIFFEQAREKPSPEWTARQNRKVDNAIKAYNEFVKAAKGGWLVDDTYSIADIAVGCAMNGIDQFDFRPGWKQQYPELAEWYENVRNRESFQQTTPILFEITEKIVQTGWVSLPPASCQGEFKAIRTASPLFVSIPFSQQSISNRGLRVVLQSASGSIPEYKIPVLTQKQVRKSFDGSSVAVKSWQ